jgi:heterodisulfide reductase subunit D
MKEDVLYYVGCTSAYRNTEIAKATVKILKKARIHFSILGLGEKCCGVPLLSAGFEKTFESLARENVLAVESRKPSLVLTTCPTCCKAHRVEYPKVLGKVGYRTVHLSEFLADLINDRRLKFASKGKKLTKVTYHDPCHLGLHMGVYDPPREVLKSIPGIELIEMERIRDRTYCCGSGSGSLRVAFPELSMSMAEERVKEAKATGAEILVTACPACLFNLEQAAKRLKLDLTVMDLGVMVASRLS